MDEPIWHRLMLFDKDGLVYDGPIPYMAERSALKYLIQENEWRREAPSK